MQIASQTKYSGMMTLRSADEIPEGFCADSLNSDHGSSSQATPLKGYSKYGHQNNVSDKIIRKFTYYRNEDREISIQVRDNGTNYIVEYLNYEDVRNSALGEWSILEAGLSRTITQKDGTAVAANFDFAPFNDTGTNQLVYGNGVEVMRIWNGATAKVSSVTSNTIVIAGTQTTTLRGFSATGSVIINGTVYTYTGVSSQTFTGVTTDPSGEAVGSGIAQKVDSSTLSAIDKGSIMIAAHQRVYIAGISGTPNQVTFSDTGDLSSWSGSLPNDGGFEDFPDLNGPITALGILNEWVVVFSKFKIVAFTYTFPSSTTRLVSKKDIADEGCVNYKSIKKVGDKLIYITPNGSIKQLSQITAENIFAVDNLTENIRPTLKNWVWDDASLLWSPLDNMLIAAGQSNSTVGVNDRAVTMQFSIDEFSAMKMNLGIIDWFINDGCMYQGRLHFGSSVASQDYLAFDGWSKDGADYSWRRTERIEYFGNRWEKKWLKFLGISGGIASGATLKITVKYGLNGSLSKQEMELKYSDSGFIVQSTLNVLGGFALGTEPLGGTNEDLGDTNPFEVLFELPHIYTRIFQITFETTGTGQNVVIQSHGYFVETANQHIYAQEIKELGTTI